MRFAGLLIFMLCEAIGAQAAQAFVFQSATGPCAKIINISISGANSEIQVKPSDLKKIIERTAQTVECTARRVPDEEARLEVLIFAIDQMVNVKTRFLIPAMDRYLAKHSEAKLRSVIRILEMTSGKIEAAIEKFTDLDFQSALAENDKEALDKLNDILLKKMERVRYSYRTLPDIELIRAEYDVVLAELKEKREELAGKLARLKAK